MKTQLTKVTPLMAAKWLLHNEGNRPVRNSWVGELSGMITRGEWKSTHQGIALNRNGKILDGQHRLMAVVDSGIAVKVLVSTDVPDETFNAIDNGSKRNFSDMYGVDSITAAVANTFARIIYGRASVDQQASILEIIKAPLHELREFSPTYRKGFTRSVVMAAAVIRMLAGEDRDYIKLVYFNIAHVKHSELPPIGRAYIDQIYARMAKTRGGDRNDLFARALKVFDKSQSQTARLTVESPAFALDYVRETLMPILFPEEEKKTPSKAASSARAKPTKLSHSARA